jgi:hypothetical protein
MKDAPHRPAVYRNLEGGGLQCKVGYYPERKVCGDCGRALGSHIIRVPVMLHEGGREGGREGERERERGALATMR